MKVNGHRVVHSQSALQHVPCLHSQPSWQLGHAYPASVLCFGSKLYFFQEECVGVQVCACRSVRCMATLQSPQKVCKLVSVLWRSTLAMLLLCMLHICMHVAAHASMKHRLAFMSCACIIVVRLQLRFWNRRHLCNTGKPPSPKGLYLEG